jgi:hypothetical protein
VRLDVFQPDLLSVALPEPPGAGAAERLGRGLRRSAPTVESREHPVGRDRLPFQPHLHALVGLAAQRRLPGDKLLLLRDGEGKLGGAGTELIHRQPDVLPDPAAGTRQRRQKRPVAAADERTRIRRFAEQAHLCGGQSAGVQSVLQPGSK